VPLLLYFLSITETDTKFSNHFEILSFELQFIVIYFWKLKNPSILGNGHLFFAGIINVKSTVWNIPNDVFDCDSKAYCN
jgi:hypothetical protein